MGFKARTQPTSKKFMFLSVGFEKPTPELMAAWQAWFAAIADRTLDQGGLWGGGHQFDKNGDSPLPLRGDSLTGYLIFTADNIEEAKGIVAQCPIIMSNQVYEIMSH